MASLAFPSLAVTFFPRSKKTLVRAGEQMHDLKIPTVLPSQQPSHEDSQRDAETLIATSKATIKNLTAKIDGAERASADQVSKRISKARKAHWWGPPTRLSLDHAWDIYNDLQTLIESLKHLEKDSRWKK